ncbi:MAG: CoA-binding protein [Arenicellales bacterium WSBS_2016_MAG_OTU3]
MSTVNTLRRILHTNKNIAVVGLSANWYRPSFFAAKYMQQHGYRIIPVNPNYEEILGERCYPELAMIPDKVDMVDVFQRTEAVMPFAQSAIDIGAKVFWQQLGVLNHEAEKMVVEAGLESVMNRCVKIEHARLFGGLNFCGVDTKIISAQRQRWLP